MNAPSYPLTIYYDASCPLCAAEMHAIRDHDGERRLKLVDCSARDFRDDDVDAEGIAIAELMQRIHARDAAGRWYRGVDVFVLAYRAVHIEAIARLWSNRRLRPFLDRLYGWVASHRAGLSRLRLNRVYGWLVRRAARKADRQSAECDITPHCGRIR